jgi:hypothetical protein
MVLRFVRQVLGVAVSLALVLGVTSQLGPQLAARSMAGYVTAVGQAQTGHPQAADSIATQLEREWRELGRSLSRAAASVQQTVSRALSGR